jgi:hypothetical protein
LEVKTAQEVYELTAQIQAKRWRGTWRIQSTDKHGVWSGERAVEAVSPALVPLYEYRRVKDGVRVYATTAQLPGKAFRRAAAPLCHVWRNPSSAVVVDYQAKPVR